MASTIKADILTNRLGTGPTQLDGQQAFRMTCLYNGVADTVLDSFNVSSLTDGAVGVDTINFTLPFAVSTYRNMGAAGTNNVGVSATDALVGSLQCTTANYANNNVDNVYVSMGSVGDLA